MRADWAFSRVPAGPREASSRGVPCSARAGAVPVALCKWRRCRTGAKKEMCPKIAALLPCAARQPRAAPRAGHRHQVDLYGITGMPWPFRGGKTLGLSGGCCAHVAGDGSGSRSRRGRACGARLGMVSAASAMVGRAWRGYVSGTARNPHRSIPYPPPCPAPLGNGIRLGQRIGEIPASSRSSMHTITQRGACVTALTVSWRSPMRPIDG